MFRGFLYSLAEIIRVPKILSLSDSMRFVQCLIRGCTTILKTKSFKGVDTCMSRDVLQVKALGERYSLINPDFALVREIYARQCYFPTRTWVPKKNDVVVDLGANAGLFSLLCAKKGCKVIAVEAQSRFCSLIASHLEKNNCIDMVQIIHGLVNADIGVFADRQRLKTASHYEVEPEHINVKEIVSRTEERPIKLLKVDIEGSEFALFEGDLSWLQQVDKIAMEVHPEFGSVETLLNRLVECGYHCEIAPSWREPTTTAITQYPGYCYAYRRLTRA